MLSHYPKELDVRAVPFEEWIEVLAHSADEPVDPERNPALKLLEFYHQAARAGPKGGQARMLESKHAERASRTLRRVGVVDEGCVGVWMGQWGVAEV